MGCGFVEAEDAVVPVSEAAGGLDVEAAGVVGTGVDSGSLSAEQTAGVAVQTEPEF